MSRALADEYIRFAQTYLGSVWALKLMLTLMQDGERPWTVDALVRELRASPLLIGQLLARFEHLGLASNRGTDGWSWQPATPEVTELSRGVADAYAVTPFGVIQAIAEAPPDSIRLFADSFRLRKE